MTVSPPLGLGQPSFAADYSLETTLAQIRDDALAFYRNEYVLTGGGAHGLKVGYTLLELSLTVRGLRARQTELDARTGRTTPGGQLSLTLVPVELVDPVDPNPKLV